MIRIKRLRSVVHSAAHHAVSGLCYVHPHLGAECRKYSYNQICVDLINLSFEPKIEVISTEISLSVSALRETFFELLASENIEDSAITGVEATFFFQRSTWPHACVVRVTINESQVVERCVDSSGRSGEILK